MMTMSLLRGYGKVDIVVSASEGTQISSDTVPA